MPFYLKVMKLGRQNTSFSAQFFSPSLLSSLYISNRWHICCDAVLHVIPLVSTLKCHPSRVSPCLFSFVLLVCCCFWNRFSLSIPRWLETYYVDLAGLELVIIVMPPLPLPWLEQQDSTVTVRPCTLSLCCLFTFVSANFSPFILISFLFYVCGVFAQVSICVPYT